MDDDALTLGRYPQDVRALPELGWGSFDHATDISHLGLTLSITCSIGISFFPSDGETVEDLLKASDTAMYHGKSKGRNNYQFYSPEMNLENLHYLEMESALRKSVQNQEFILHYQPQIDLRTGRSWL